MKRHPDPQDRRSGTMLKRWHVALAVECLAAVVLETHANARRAVQGKRGVDFSTDASPQDHIAAQFRTPEALDFLCKAQRPFGRVIPMRDEFEPGMQ